MVPAVCNRANVCHMSALGAEVFHDLIERGGHELIPVAGAGSFGPGEPSIAYFDYGEQFDWQREGGGRPFLHERRA